MKSCQLNFFPMNYDKAFVQGTRSKDMLLWHSGLTLMFEHDSVLRYIWLGSWLSELSKILGIKPFYAQPYDSFFSAKNHQSWLFAVDIEVEAGVIRWLASLADQSVCIVWRTRYARATNVDCIFLAKCWLWSHNVSMLCRQVPCTAWDSPNPNLFSFGPEY